MATSAIPAVIDALFDQSTKALPNANVVDGYGVSGNTGDTLMIGVEDPGNLDSASSAETDQSAATMGTNRSRDEDGTVVCVAESWNGNSDQKAARDAAFATVAAVENLIRKTDTPALGVAGVRNARIVSHQLLQDQRNEGAVAFVVFRVGFTARI